MAIDEDYILVLLKIRGMVQGVGFRYWTYRCARDLSLSGYVRNLPDRSVEVLLKGTESQVKQMEQLLKTGPRHAVVQEIETVRRYHTVIEAGDEFTIKR